MIKYQMSILNKFNEVVFISILSTSYSDACFTAKFYGNDFFIERLDGVLSSN